MIIKGSGMVKIIYHLYQCDLARLYLFNKTCWVDLSSQDWSVQVNVYTVHVFLAWIMQLLEWGEFTVQFILYSLYSTVYTVQFILYSLYSTVYSVQFILYSLFCTAYTVQFL